MALTVLAVADQVSPVIYDHFTADRWKRIDFILSCGDLPPEYLDFLCTQIGVPVFYVRGNHDGAFRPSQYDGFENLHGRVVSYRGIRITGFEGSRRYNRGTCQFSEGQMRRVAAKSRLRLLRHGPPDIVVTHAPPAGLHDGQDPCHRGFEVFRHLIDSWRPSFVVHGHTHAHFGSEWSTRVGRTTVLNAFPYRVFEVEPRPRGRHLLPGEGSGRPVIRA